LFTLTTNGTSYKENLITLISKIIMVKEYVEVNLSNLSKILGFMQMDELYIFSIDAGIQSGIVNINRIKEKSLINYIELSPEDFAQFLNIENSKFIEYNKNSLYILRNGSYIDIKNLFTKVNGCNVTVGRGGSQKAHMISPLDFRLTSYILAMFNFNSKLISSLNTFNDISKDRYLLYFDKNNKS
jgi:hypothetical protein